MGEVEREEEYNPIQEYPEQGIQDKLREWYIARGTKAAESLEKRGIDIRDERDFADLATRQKNLEGKAKENVDEFKQLKEEVERLAAANGVKFDAKTGEVSFDGERDLDVQQAPSQEISEVSARLSRVSDNHSTIAKNLYGEDMANPNFDPEKSKNPGIVAVVNQKKQALMKRDASVKKLLDAKVRLEVAKDKMDMHGARHVAEKYRLMMILEQLKLQLIREIASGGKENDAGVKGLREQIAGVTRQIDAMEVQFKETRSLYSAEFGAAKKELEDSTKFVEYDNKELEGSRNSNYALSYSEDGILNGSSFKGRQNDRPVEEKEVFDERGVMIFDVADVLSREKNVQINGITVTCVTEFGPGPNIEDSFYIGEMEQLEVNTADSRAVVEEKPDIGEEQDNTEVGNLTTISVFQRELSSTVYKLNEAIIESVEALNGFSPEQQQAFNVAINMLSRANLSKAIIDRVIEEIQREALERAEEGTLDPDDPNFRRENFT